MEQASIDEIIQQVPESSNKVEYAKTLVPGENLGGKDSNGLAQLFTSIMGLINSHYEHPLSLKTGWGNWEYGDAGIFFSSISEDISLINKSFPSRLWKRFKTTAVLRVNSHYDQRIRKLHVFFYYENDYETSRNTIKSFIADNPNLRIRKLVMYLSEANSSIKIKEVVSFS